MNLNGMPLKPTKITFFLFYKVSDNSMENRQNFVVKAIIST